LAIIPIVANGTTVNVLMC